MKIELHEITIKEIAENYRDSAEEGVVGYGGRLNIRPKYQREFVYKDAQRDAVIETILKGFPLNVMYWVKNNEDSFEVLDGQQRTISICQYIQNIFSILIEGKPYYFKTLTDTERAEIENYKLMIYFCEGNDKEKLDWFKTINIAGEKLEEQELRNAIYTGEWLTDAKRHFSKINCPAYGLSKNYLNGEVNRQKYLETAIKWLSEDKIEKYMAEHQHEQNANELWLYFQRVIQWVQATFPNYRKEMKGIEWGFLYNQFGDKKFNTNELENKIKRLMIDDDVTKKSGIYWFVLTGKEKYLNIRAFTPNQIRESYERQEGNCVICGKHFEMPEMEADHITPWSKGGKTISENCQMLCKVCNRRKSGK